MPSTTPWVIGNLDRGQRTNDEVAVVGGSAAGLFTAYLLGRSGLRVRIFESADRLGLRPRTLIVTSHMQQILGHMGQGALVNEIRRFELFTDGRVAKLTLRQPDLVIERSKLIQALAHGAQEAGAQVLLGRRFVSLREDRGRLALAIERNEDAGTEEVRAQIVIGADGAFSRVARTAGWPRQVTVPLVQSIVRLPADMEPHTTRVWFIPEDTPYFYWLIPESSTRGALGLIGEDGQKARHLLERFVERQRLTPLEFQGARVPLYTQWIPVRRRLAGGDIYLVGDAAGHVKVTTVGGIVTGFRGALGVVEAILNGGSLKLRVLRRELELHLLIRKIIHGFTQPSYSRLVDLLNASARHDLEDHTRDQLRQLLWRLCLHQPRLMLLSLRALVSGAHFLRRSAPIM